MYQHTPTPANTSINANSYDELPYESYVFPQTHPNSLATVGILFGMNPPALENCRILELGCGDGTNLCAIAQTLPNAELVGVDLSIRQVQDGLAVIAELGLSNVTLKHLSITDVDESFGMFDYIICHGVYSWVPDFVQEKIMQICHDRLNPTGIAYISYNTYPGWHSQGMLRQMMLYHTRHLTEPAQRIAQAKELLKFLADANKDKTDFYSLSLQNHFVSLKDTSEKYLFHEYLEENNKPIFFYEFVDRAREKNLQYLGDQKVINMLINQNFSPETREILGGISDLIQLEQYMDFLKNRPFRQSLLCHQDIKLDRQITSAQFMNKNLRFSSSFKCSDEINLCSNMLEEFIHSELTFKVDQPLYKSALISLTAAFPHSLSLDELIDSIEKHLAPCSVALNIPIIIHRASVSQLLLDLYLRNLLKVSVSPDVFTTVISEKPQVNGLARIHARRKITIARHSERTLPDLTSNMTLVGQDIACLITLLDGQHTREQIVESLMRSIESGSLHITYKDGHALNSKEEIHSQLMDFYDSSLKLLTQTALLSA